MEPNGHRRLRRRDHLVQENGDPDLSCSIDELDPWTAWAYKPRTISFLFVGACFLMMARLHWKYYASFGVLKDMCFKGYYGYSDSMDWASGALDPESNKSGDLVTSVKRGVWAMIAVFLTYCLLQAPSTVLIRPHPAVWRLVHGMAVVYLVALTFLLFQTRDDARQFMKFLHPDLGVELPERSYGADCRIYIPENPSSRFKNVYVWIFLHNLNALLYSPFTSFSLGWWGKAILIRNQPLLWVLSTGFEFMELTFRHMLPNFNECWWDSIILDIFTCNWFGKIPHCHFIYPFLFGFLVGIWAGMHTVRYFDGRTYEWVGISRQPNIIGKVKRTLGQFTPAQWDKDEWHPLLGPWRFIQVLSLCIVFLTVELNTFFLKFCLWIPPRNPVIVYRLILWWLIAIPTIREYNLYLQDRYYLILSLSICDIKPVKKVGAFCWLSLAICIIELLICIKFGHGLYPKPMPRWLVVFWLSMGSTLVLFLMIWSWKLQRSYSKKRR
ncbi:CDP-diacylglycerol--serine O-phosphatidyltransferase 1-like isoform X2 [Gossypium australe]|uniref:CDP-diacylglycerol--serine O-phosphatidyltransferase n=2 Tax=Magnoliopsida TaxID=3398 RepID=A0A5B6UHR9_9ROSI|nr:CDP-diacylglycerol--serine O-phosphatidyltransferase 1-like isoform X2 [Gossypium australe]